jgi:hexosaminidase
MVLLAKKHGISRSPWRHGLRDVMILLTVATLCVLVPPHSGGSSEGAPVQTPEVVYDVVPHVTYTGNHSSSTKAYPSQVGQDPPTVPARWHSPTASNLTTPRPPSSGIMSAGSQRSRPLIFNQLAPPTTIGNLIPRPVSVSSSGSTFSLTMTTDIYVQPGTTELVGIGQSLANKLNPATGYGMQVFTTRRAPAQGNIYLTIAGGDPALGDEGYQLTVTPELVTLVAYRPAGLFRGIQTLRQLLPPAIEHATVQRGPWTMATGTVRDYPRFAWRGAMLDVARHFFSVADVKRYIDLIAYYKLNRLHLHLTDDQGWRIMINAWPKLATYGGSTQVGGGRGGYYTQAEYADIVAYAHRRYMLVVPEIDMPGHTHAALASYAELNCDGVAPPLYTGTAVAFSSLCLHKPITDRFVQDVISEIAALTPGPYIHIGGDEAPAPTPAAYIDFIEQVQTIVQSHGKQMLGWEEIGQAHLLTTSVAQHWNDADQARAAADQGVKLIMSPATKTYLDMKYDASTPLGLNWAGYTDVQDGYTWDPATQIAGVPGSRVLGLEAPLWTETIRTMDQVEFMAFPRLVGHAEIGWSPATGRTWAEYRNRLGAHGPRLSALGVNYYRSSQVPWRGASSIR